MSNTTATLTDESGREHRSELGLGELIVSLAGYRQQQPQTRLQGVHFFPFGGLKRTAEWLAKIAQGEFELTSKGGIEVA